MDYPNIERRLLELLAADGAPKTNRYLRETLDVDEDVYWKVRDRLREQGHVIRMPGHGGRTARVVNDEEELEDSLSKWWSTAQQCAYVLAACVAVVGLALFIYLLLTSKMDLGTGSVLLSLLFGVVSLFAAGVAVNIYRLQAAQRVEDNYAQAGTNKRLEKLMGQAAQSSSEARDFVWNMKAAEVAAAVPSADDDESSKTAVESAAEDEPSAHALDHGTVIRSQDGVFYRPWAVPLKTLADVVGWWRRPGGASGAWTVENLVGGYRPYNKSRGLTGVPWILVFKGNDGDSKAFKITSTGRARTGEASSKAIVERYSAEDNRWDNFNPSDVESSR